MKPDELERAYRAYGREVYLYAFSLCRNPHEAEELVSDAFFKAFLSLEESRAPLRYWLLRVCRNCFLDRLRRRRTHPEDELRDLPADFDVADRLIAGDERQALYRWLLRLPARSREVLSMSYFLGLSAGEIAALTGQTQGAVRTALCRARAALRQIAKEEQE